MTCLEGGEILLTMSIVTRSNCVEVVDISLSFFFKLYHLRYFVHIDRKIAGVHGSVYKVYVNSRTTLNFTTFFSIACDKVLQQKAYEHVLCDLFVLCCHPPPDCTPRVIVDAARNKVETDHHNSTITLPYLNQNSTITPP